MLIDRMEGQVLNEYLMNNEKGFSFIEVLIAMGLFAIGSIAIVSLYYASTGSVRTSAEKTEAVFIAEKFLNATLARQYDGACTDCMKNRDETDGKYKIAIRIDRTGITTTEEHPVAVNTALIDVTVSWGKGLMSQQHSVQYIRAETKSSGI